MVVAPLLLEQLREMVLAVDDAFERSIGRWRKLAAPMRAFEAGLVVGFAFHGQLPERRLMNELVNVS